ncbi:MAG: alpha/beta hydrolase [Candidatus Binatia bacterium]|nr:alpha/beta hydrolase [Candidatus Binatia bacterium]
MPAGLNLATVPLVLIALLSSGPPHTAEAAYDDALWTVQKTTGVVYGQGRIDNGATWKDLLLDLYEPIGNPDIKKPAMVLIHGGGFTGGNRGSMTSYGNYFASRGYVAVSISYRLQGENPTADPAYAFWPTDPGLAPAVHAAAVDGARAVRWLRANAATLGIDPNFVMAGGISAGGITAGNLGIAGPAGEDAYQTELPGDVALPVNNPGHSSQVQGVLSYCGGAGPSVPDAADAPLLLIHTTGDGTVPVLLPDVIASWYDSAPAPHEYYRLDGGGHCTFLGGLVDGLTVTDLSTRFLNRMVWEVEPEPMLARRLIVKDVAAKPQKRRLSFVAIGDGSSSATSLPAVGSSEDPTAHGMVIDLYASTGDPNDYQRMHLPAEGWLSIGTDVPKSYKYKDKTGVHGPVRKVLLKSNKLKVIATGAALLDLAGAPHGGFSIRVRLADGAPWCATTVAATDTTSRYVGAPQQTALPCEDLPGS